VAAADLTDLLAEFWREFYLRRGSPAVPLAELEVSLEPVLEGRRGPRCLGLRVEAENGRGEAVRREYPLEVFGDSALAAAQELVRQGTLEDDSKVYYEVLARRAAEPARTPPAPPAVAPLRYLTEPLTPLLDSAKPVGQLDAAAFPVFYTEEALEKSERFSRRGAVAHPPVETGAVLVGWLSSCPDSGEFFVVVSDALEAADTEGGEYSLFYTGKTWARLRAVMKARQRGGAGRALAIVGQCHGHNFLPLGGAPQCEACPGVKVCARSSAFVSSEDRLWSRAVFHRQPWQLCHIFGLDARGERVQRLFTLEGNRLRERGYHLLARFRPSGSFASSETRKDEEQ
jgi:hypothetical protein